MKGWILHQDSSEPLKPQTYENARFMEVAVRHGIELRIVNPNDFDLLVTKNDEESILLDGKPVELPDFIFPRMGAYTTYFGLAVIRHLEKLGVHSLNSAQSIETARDKLYTHQILAGNNIPVPKTMLVKFPVDASQVERNLGFPVVVKTLSGSQGSGVFLSENRESFIDLMQLIEVTNRNANIIMQEFIADSRGQDLRVITIGGRAVACMRRVATDGKFKTNFSQGGSVEAFELTPEIEWLATQASQQLNLNMAGVDLLFAGDHFKVCEVNSSPGFEGLERCCSIDVPHEVFHYMRVRLGLFQTEQAKVVPLTPLAALK